VRSPRRLSETPPALDLSLMLNGAHMPVPISSISPVTRTGS